MGLPIVTIDRGVPPGAPQTAGGTSVTDAKSTPTFLSSESLTFPGVSLVSLGLVQIWETAVGHDVSNLQIFWLAAGLGAALIILGLSGNTNDTKNFRNIFGQVVIGVINTVLLYGVMLGVSGI